MSSHGRTASLASTSSHTPETASQTARAQPELRVYLLIENIQRQFAAYLGTPTRARGYPALEGSHALIVEISPALAIERIIDLALKAVPAVEPGLLYVERQFGILEVHGYRLQDVHSAGKAILDGIGSVAEDQLKPRTLFVDVIEDIGDQHAIILNRTRQASMVMPGETLLVYEMTPALFASVAANEAERAVSQNTLVDVQMIGAAGRVYISGTLANVSEARDAISALLLGIEGREQT
jgi:hypothetical protein